MTYGPAWDANLECRHGRIPFDPSPVCMCFPIELGVVVKLPARYQGCECGCGERPARGRRFLPGHNHFKKRAV